MALMYADKGREEDAERMARQSLAVIEAVESPENRLLPAAYHNLGGTYLVLGKPADAIPLYERAATILEEGAAAQPESPDAQNELAWTLVLLARAQRMAGERGASRAAAARSAEIVGPFVSQVDDVGLLDTYAQALLLAGEVESARPVVEKLLAQGWDNEDFLVLCQEHGLIEHEEEDSPVN